MSGPEKVKPLKVPGVAHPIQVCFKADGLAGLRDAEAVVEKLSL